MNTYLTTSTRTHALDRELSTDLARIKTAATNGETAYLDDCSALTIAAGWQSPGTQGRAFAQLASTGTVALEALAEDIEDARLQADTDQREALDLLLMWACVHPSLQSEADDGEEPNTDNASIPAEAVGYFGNEEPYCNCEGCQ
ncbi:hypothetical protein [Streptomyces sp. SID13031]|uniref:hypothetical protein n=1 Tax=Streptomyces sp. SID13031 TaxID=2706046 RepID=UPI0013CA9DF9|nr:hypothetical protein [Streptomyces sp. SID13031]NEA37563.1 hypothetical protein [Streptomyces sp. SID13031]